MIKKIVKGYPLVTAFNWGIAAVLIVVNVYLYPRLPQKIPAPFGAASHLSNKWILWVFPLIFLVLAFFLNEKRLDQVVKPAPDKTQWLKFVSLVVQLLLWVILLRSYATYFLFI